MPSNKKQKLSKDEKARRKLKSHSSKDPLPPYDNGDWSRKGDSMAYNCGSKKNIKSAAINDYWIQKLEIKAKDEEKEQRNRVKLCDMCYGSGRMYLAEGCYSDCDFCGGFSGEGMTSNINEGY